MTPRPALLLALACGLAGCAAPDGRTEVVFWGMGREGEVVGELVPAFEAEHPGIRVRVQQIPWSAAHEKMLTAYVGGAVPDVAQLGNTWVAELAALDALAPLDSLVAATPGLGRADVFGGIWDTNVVSGTLYGLPWYVDTRLLFYRPSVLAAAGIDAPPATWAEWRAAMEAGSDPAAGRYALLAPPTEWTLPVVLGMQAGSPLLRDGDRYGAFRGDDFRRAFAFLLGLYRDGLAVPPGAQPANMYQAFARGDLSMVVTGPWNLGEFRSQLPDSLQSDWATAPLPGPDGPGTSTAGGSSLVLFRGAAHPEAAWAFASYLARPDVQALFYEKTGSLPARISAWERAGLTRDPRTRAFADQLRRARPTPTVPEWERVATLVARYAEAAARGAMTEDAALAALDADVDALLEKRRWLLARAAGTRAAGMRHAGTRHAGTPAARSTDARADA